MVVNRSGTTITFISKFNDMLKKKVLNSQTAFFTSFILLLPVKALAQATATETLAYNHQIIEMLGLVTPLSINP
jgi:hypothetical protein